MKVNCIHQSQRTMRIMVLAAVFAISLLMVGAGCASETSGTDGGISWSIDGSTLTIQPAATPLESYESGRMPDYVPRALPWKGNESLITSIVINDGVLNIGNAAFNSFSSVTSVSIPNSVTTIGNRAFKLCESLQNVTIPSSVVSIGQAAFEDSDGLQNVYGCEHVTNVGGYCFDHCNNLKTISLTAECEYVGDYAFQSCRELQSVGNLSGVTTVGAGAFYDCEKLTGSLNLDSIQYIKYAGFQHCDLLTSVTFGSSIKEIGESGFQGCDNMTQIIFNGSVNDATIGDYAFERCAKITSLLIPEGVTSVGTGSFAANPHLRILMLPSTLNTIGTSLCNDDNSLQMVVINATNCINVINNIKETCDSVVFIVSDYSTQANYEPKAIVDLCGGMVNDTFVPKALEQMGNSRIILPDYNAGDMSMGVGMSFYGWYDATNAKMIAKVTVNDTGYYYLPDDCSSATVDVPQTTVTFSNPAGVTGGDSEKTEIFGNPAIDVQTGTFTEHTFGGYWTQENGSGECIFASNGHPVKGNTYIDEDGTWDYQGSSVTLYGYWVAYDDDYTTLHLNNNGISETALEVIEKYQNSVSPVNYGSIPDSIFEGYWTESGGAGTKVFKADGSANNGAADYITSDGKWAHSKTTSATVELYGNWVPYSSVQTTVKFNNEHASPSDKTYTYNQSLINEVIEYGSYSGYIFDGYWTGSGGTGEQVFGADGRTVRETSFVDANGNWKYNSLIHGSTVTLYANWVSEGDVQTSVTFHLLSPSGTEVSTQNYTYGTTAQDAPSVGSHAGYTFKGFYAIESWTQESVVGTQVFGTDSKAVSGSHYNDKNYVDGSGKWAYNSRIYGSTLHLYGEWVASKTTVTFYESYMGSSNPQQVETYGELPLSAGHGLRDGYEFGGYWTGQNGTGVQVFNADDSARKGTSYINSNGRWSYVGNSLSLYGKWTKPEDVIATVYLTNKNGQSVNLNKVKIRVENENGNIYEFSSVLTSGNTDDFLDAGETMKLTISRSDNWAANAGEPVRVMVIYNDTHILYDKEVVAI